MNLSDKPCYPILNDSKEVGYGHHEYLFYQCGLTFRERLIIALASNIGNVVTVKDYHESNAIGIIQQADEIIKELEKWKLKQEMWSSKK